MELLLKRIARRQDYTIGRLYVNGVYFCDTLEDFDRLHFGGIKVKKQTAIPAGKYEVTQQVKSPRYSTKPWYVKVCGAYMPRLLRIPMFEGVLIHPGNSHIDTEGCILVGRNTAVGRLTDSRAVWLRLMQEHLLPAKKRGEKVTIEIQ